MRVKSEFCNEPGVASVRIEFWPENGKGVSVISFRRTPPYKQFCYTGIELGVLVVHSFSKDGDADCQYSPSGHCFVCDLLGSTAVWMGKFRELITTWRIEPHHAVHMMIKRAGFSMNVWDYEVPRDYYKMLSDISLLICAELKPELEDRISTLRLKGDYDG